MTFINMVRAGAAVLGLIATAGLAAAQNAPKVTSNDICPQALSSLGDAKGTIVMCWCPGAGRAGSVWGSGPYTIDSDLCGAARHAGLVPAEGAAIWAQITRGEQSYTGSTANGIQTSDYGSYGASISLSARAAPAAAVAPCPTTMQGQSGALSCACSAAATTAGAVWGTDIYTEDSAICRAALHAGSIGSEGGNVSIVSVGSQPKYTGSTRNGVISSDYGAWGASYMFAN